MVADEVRNLAARTHESTSDIQDMIERLQDGSQQAMEVMTQGRMMAISSVEQASIAGRCLAQITDAVMGIMEQNDHLAKATEAQNQTLQDIDRSVLNISSTSA